MPHLSTNRPTDARVLMVSTRSLKLHASRSSIYEFEDVVRECDSVDLVSPHDSLGLFKVTNRLANKAVRAVRSVPSLINYRYSVDRDYDLMVFCCQLPQDILLLNSIDGWRERCRTAVCWLDEIWAKDIDEMHAQLRLLKDFDVIFMNFDGSMGRVADITGVPCVPMAFGVDCLRFFPTRSDRPIDVLNMGRRSAVTHRSLLDAAGSGDFFYYYNSINGLNMVDAQEHRDLYANLSKRARYTIVNKAKFNLLGSTNPQEEVGPRFYEAAAAGSVMLGVRPRCKAFDDNLDWPDAVVDIPFDCPDITTVLDDLDRQPERVERIRRANLENSLSRHDWVYRWELILRTVGISGTVAMAERRSRLDELRQTVMPERPARSLPAPRREILKPTGAVPESIDFDIAL